MFFAPSKLRWRAKIWIMGVSKTLDNIQIKIKMKNPSQEPPASPKALYEEDIGVLCTFKIKISTKPKPNPNQDQDADPQSGTSTVLQSLK